MEKKEFTGVWIPRHIIDNPTLSGIEKIIYAEIASFPVCYMSNKMLAEKAGCSEKSVSRSIKKMLDMGVIEFLKSDGRGRYLRVLYDTEPPEEVVVNDEKGERVVKMSRGVDKMSSLGGQIVHIDNNESIYRIHTVAPVGDDKGKVRVSPPAESVPFDVKVWVTSLMESDQRHIRLIGYYLGKYADHHLPNKKVANDELKKNLKPASYLVENFSKEDISKTLKYCASKFKDVHWNLATVKKQITYVTAKKEE